MSSHDFDDRRSYATALFPVLGLPYVNAGGDEDHVRRQSLGFILMGEDSPIWGPITDPGFGDDVWNPVDDPFGD